MKNRNYLILGNLMAIVFGLIFGMLTLESSGSGYNKYFDPISWIIIVVPLILLYMIAFPDINQFSYIKIMLYKMKWIQDMVIYLGIMGLFLGLSFLWGSIFYTGLEDINYTPVTILSRSLSIGFITIIYSVSISFSFYVLAFFIKGKDDIPSTNLGKRIFVHITALIVNIIVFSLASVIGSFGSGISILSSIGLFNKYIFLLLFGVLVFFHFQSNSSIAMLLKNLFCDFEESNDSIKGQLQAIFNTKRFVMGLCLIALIFIPTALFSILSYVISDSTQIFNLLIGGTQLLLWGFFIIVMLTTLEGKYNYKLFQYDGSIIEDRMFLPKFVALPTILYLLMVVILFILSNVLF